VSRIIKKILRTTTVSIMVLPRILVPSALRLLSFSSLTLVARTLEKQSFIFPGVLSHCQKMSFTTEQFGTPFTENFRVYFKNDEGLVSPFHDIPMFADKENGVFNMVVEIPKWENAKMEISTKDDMNPIKQDIKKGKVRFVKNVFPFRGYMWNYGAIPQTWEDPMETDEHTGQKGDGDPIDVVEIGFRVAKRGEIKQVKILGVLALIDEGETDWKVIAIDVNDPLAPRLNDIGDVRKTMPGLIEATHEWFKTYKIPAGSGPNEFAFEGEAKDRKFTFDVIMQTHEQWKKLVLKKMENEKKLAVNNVSVEDSPYKITQEKAKAATEGLPALTVAAALPDDVDMMYYLTKAQKDGVKE